MNALSPVVSVTAFTNEAALLWIGENGPPPSVAELARLIDRDNANLRKSLLLLVEEGLLDKDYSLTFAGRDAYDALRRMRGSAGLIEIDPALIDPNPYQPRKVEDPDADAEMAISVRDKGIAQPIRARKIGDRYQQAFGHRRVKGAKAAGRLVPCIVSDLSDNDMMELAGIENCQRSNLHWMDEAEYYLMLAEHGRSAAQIIALVGEGGRSKRKVQELIQFARELSDEDKARCRLPKGHPQGLTVEQCRERTGEKSEKPPLDLSPKLTLALLELLDAAERQGRPINGAERVVQLFAAPTGGPIATLVNDRRLARFAFEGPTILVKITVTEDMAKLLGMLRFDLDRAGTLRKARADVLGELQVNAMRPGEYATPELNRPAAPTAPVAAPTPQPQPAHPREGGDPSGLAAADDHDDARTESVLTPAPPPTPDEPERLQLIPAFALALFEIAHRIGDGDLAATPVEIAPDYYQDKLPQSLVFEKLIKLAPKGAATVLNLTPKAVSFVCDALGGALDDTHYEIGDDQLQDLQEEYAGAEPTVGRYITSWLNLKAATSPAEAPALADDPLSPTERRVLREIAARSLHRSNLPDDGVTAHADALSDPAWQSLYERAMVTRLPDHRLALTREGVAYLKTRHAMPERKSANSCDTPWLRDDYVPGGDASAATANSEAPPPRPTDSFSRQLNALSGEAKAMAGLAGSLREAIRLLTASRSRKLATHEIDQVCNLGEAALETAAKYLED